MLIASPPRSPKITIADFLQQKNETNWLQIITKTKNLSTMTTILVADLPDYVQTSQLVIDAKNYGIAEITCPYPIPPTTKMNNMDEFEALYYACGYFQIDMFDKYKEFMDRRKSIPRLVKFLLMKTAASHEFDKIYRYAMYVANTTCFYYGVGNCGCCEICSNCYVKCLITLNDCGCVYCDVCMKNAFATCENCQMCNKALYEKI